MESSAKPSKMSSSTRSNQNNLKEKYARKSHENVLKGDKIKIVRYKEKDVEKLKEKYSVKKSDAHIPFDEDFLDSVKSNIENKMGKDTIVKSPETEEIVSPKVNVFQFMMNSRHKVIGSNSPGKEKKPELEKSPENVAEKKEKIKKRKTMLGEWAEKKGGQKRKLADDAQEEYIKKTMKERAKRLKKMLEIIDEDLRNSSHDESDYEVRSTKKSKNTNTEKDDDIKSAEIDESAKNLIDESEMQKSDSDEDENKIKSSETIKNTPIIRPKRSKKSNSNILEKNLVEMKSDGGEKETPKRQSKRKQIISDSENDQNKVEKSNIETNQNAEESNKKPTKNVKKSIGNLSLKKNKKSLTPEAEQKIEPELKTESTKILSDDVIEDIFPINTPVSSKKIRQLKLFQDSNSKTVEQENKSFTPRSWKMKVRLLEKENINDELDDDAESVFIVDDKESPKRQQIQGKISSFFGSATSPNKSNSSESSKNKDVKIAPLFLKQQSKKLTKAEVEAKKIFLYSGMPEQVKKVAANQKSINEIEFDLFPKISHVQQRSSNDETLDIFWDLPNTSLFLVEKNIETMNKMTYETLTYGTLTDCAKTETLKNHIYSPPTKLPNIKEYITALKKEYPNYPVFKTFRLLYEKHIKHNKIESSQADSPVSVKKRRGRSKKTKIPNKTEIVPELRESQMWTEKYKPLGQDDIVGNYSSVKQLKCWLQLWVHYSDYQKFTKKRKRANSSSDDFCNDSDTRDTEDTLPQNMIILVGPFGSGKTASVYALCNELNINVIEINASSKRTGKRILTELQEATQSHQVKNTDSKSVNSFFQKKTELHTNTNTNNNINIEIKEEEKKKLSLLLMEDVDIVFEDQDDGFISSLTTLVSSSKRPIILTTSDKNCLHLQKLFSQYDVIDFNSISCRVASPWLHILCLIEGIRTDKVMIERLLDWNKGDLRKTILQLQFWVQSGGDSTIVSSSNLNNKLKLTKYSLSQHDEEPGTNDESSNLSWLQSDTSKMETDAQNVHKSCVEYFTPFYEKDKMCFQLSFPINLGNIWWNIPSILSINSVEHKEIFKSPETLSNNEKETDHQSDIDCSQNATKFLSDAEISSEINDQSDGNDKNQSDVLFLENSQPQPQPDLITVANFLESLVFTDTMYVKLKTDLDFEPISQFWQISPVNSLSLTENYEMYNVNNNLSFEISQWLVEQNMRKCKKLDDCEFNVNVAVPDLEERKWRIKIHKSMEDLTDIIPPSSLLDRTAICEDYFPFMRTVCRVENTRFANNNKRKNRFYHYFKTFNIHLSDSSNLILCNSLAIKNY